MDDGFVEVSDALDDFSSQIEGLDSSAVHRRIPYDFFRQVIGKQLNVLNFDQCQTLKLYDQ